MSDKNFSQVQLLCGFDGADGATAFTDESSAARAATFVGNAQLDTAQVKYGSASAMFDGTGDAITFADAAALNLAAGDFTIETWVRFAAFNAGADDLISQWLGAAGNRGWIFGHIDSTDLLRFAYSTTGSNAITASIAWTPSLNQWYHIAACRIATNLRLFIDGVTGAAHNIGTSTIFNSPQTITLGSSNAAGASNPLNGWLDDSRITVGLGRYAANFVPPQGPFSRGKRLGQAGEGGLPILTLAA